MKWIAGVFVFGLLASCSEKPVDAPNMPVPVVLPAQYEWVSPSQVVVLRKKLPDLGVLDVRDDSEMRDGRGWIAGARPCSLFGGNEAVLKSLDRERPWLVYCALGGRSELVAKSMATLGFTKVYLLKGGFVAWRTEGQPTVK